MPETTRAALIAVCVALLMSGCTNLGYYLQSVSGQLDIWRREQAIEDVVRDPATSVPIRDKLARIVEIRDFASRELKLPENRSYRRYADLERPFVVWNVFAAPEFSVRPVQWCFMFAGCVGYRGYFNKADADRFAAELADQGHDVFVGGVPAYSTLGWFADPVLNTFIHYPETEIARIIFHELAHQVVYVKDDTVFNESFAVSVEAEGVRRWLDRAGSERQRAEFERAQRFRAEFAALIENYRGKLEALYRTRLAEAAMRERKDVLLNELGDEYERLKAGWGGYAGYDRWFARKPNNAQLASVAIYAQQVPAFQALLRREGGDLKRFYAAVKDIAILPKDERAIRLKTLAAHR
jgi:predicted aminopeptidase